MQAAGPFGIFLREFAAVPIFHAFPARPAAAVGCSVFARHQPSFRASNAATPEASTIHNSYRRKIDSRPEVIQAWLLELRSACALTFLFEPGQR